MRRLVPAVLAAVLLASGCAELQQQLEQQNPGAGSVTPGPAATNAGQAQAQLAKLRVAKRGSMSGYDREDFGQSWSDDVDVAGGHNGCDTRNDILKRDLTAVTFKAGTKSCVVQTGSLADPYTGTTIAFNKSKNASAVQIDHVVPLGEAWRAGASKWPADKRKNLANDPLELVAVSGSQNESKGDSGPDSWRPKNRSDWCRYAVAYIQVKTTYQLSTQQSEKDALAQMLGYCKAGG